MRAVEQIGPVAHHLAPHDLVNPGRVHIQPAQFLGQRVSIAGLVLVRQRPGSASGVIFMTLEDETGVANVTDPLGGSYFIESLTNRMEEQAEEYWSQREEAEEFVADVAAAREVDAGGTHDACSAGREDDAGGPQRILCGGKGIDVG